MKREQVLAAAALMINQQWAHLDDLLCHENVENHDLLDAIDDLRGALILLEAYLDKRKGLPPVKQQKHKADDLLEWLKEHNGFDGDATALAKAWKPDDALGRTTTVLLLKQLKDAGHIKIIRHGPHGVEIRLN
ncbi:hypothetical protein DWH07_02310 [Escherichia coli]|nr:hypothetical protein [Escherichia coli]EEY9397632.1 hypothetical protein [Escherichia coli]EFM3175881.1 hypothetical protein [Escherichia coli]EFO1586385.1 hypothetical protein [Escherichia coli]EJS1730059.1 hypothetical protein [Escherichia coli]